MQYSELDINMAEGIRLVADIQLGEQLYPKGHALTAEDIIIFKMFGIRRIYGAETGRHDLDASAALGIIAAKLCGENTAFHVDNNGHCRIIAQNSGVLMLSVDRVAKLNRMHQSIVLNTAKIFSLVEKDEIVAELELRTPLIAQDEVDEIIFKLSGNTALLNVATVSTRRAALIYSKITEDLPPTEHFTTAVTKLVKELAGLGVGFEREFNAKHTIDSLADEIERSIRSGHHITFILPALQGSGFSDVVPAAVRAIADDIVCESLPIWGAADFMVADKRGHRIIVLPYNYAQTSVPLIEDCIKQAVFTEKLYSQDFSSAKPPFLSAKRILSADEQQGFIKAKNDSTSDKKANIAAIILAAGKGSRSGRNKLLVDVGNNTPLFMKAVDAAIGSKAGPVFVITGYRNEEMQEFLEDRDVNVIYNPSYDAGVRTSIELGLKAVPNFCDGAILIPADMPNITSAELNKMIAKFKVGVEKQVISLAHKGTKTNPILWSKALFEHAEIVPENAQMRVIFMEHADYTATVDIRDKNKLLDVTYPADFKTLGIEE